MLPILVVLPAVMLTSRRVVPERLPWLLRERLKTGVAFAMDTFRVMLLARESTASMSPV